MKTLAATLLLVSLASIALADKKPTPKPTAAQARAKDAAMSSIRNMRIKEINEKDKVFTATAPDGKEYRFTFQKMEGMKVGSVVEVTYTGPLGGPKPAMASNLNLSKSNIN